VVDFAMIPVQRVELEGAALNRRLQEVTLTGFGAILLLVAAFDKHPYGFYMVLRLVTTVGGIYWAWRVRQAKLPGWTWVFTAVALLMNPILPLRMHRTDWQPIDLGLGVLLLGWSGFWFFRKTE
jgi:hypothetical protein